MNEQPKFVKQKIAKNILGVSPDTLRRWADSNKIPSVRTAGGTRLYNVKQFLLQQQEEKVKINSSYVSVSNQNSQVTSTDTSSTNTVEQCYCYCRVSSQKQKDDLERQVKDMQERFPGYTIISDIGSGINWKRKGLRQILDLVYNKRCKQVVVAYRDRLCRFAFELFEWIFQQNGVKLVVLNDAVDSAESSELAEDLLAIINIFNCRVNGKRKYKSKPKAGSKQSIESEKRESQGQ